MFFFLVHEKLRSEAKKNLRERERERERETYCESEGFAGLFLETKKASEGERERGRERVSERGHAVTLRREMITESDLYVHVGVNFKNLHF